MATTTLGRIKPCCLYEDNFNTGLKEFWNSKEMQSVRAGHLKGEEIPGCESCWKLERAGIKSKRQTDNEKFSHLKDRVKKEIVEFPPAYLDIKLSNLCNLKCRICGVWSSSSWATEEAKRLKGQTIEESRLVQIALKSRRWIQGNNEFWDYLNSISGEIEAFDFTGGEPFMIPEHWKFLRTCVEKGVASNITLHYNTNATVFPKDYALWKEFKEVEIMCSIDDIEKRFEYQRHPAKWEITEKNMKFFRSQDFIRTTICTTVNMHNIYYLPELIQWAKEQKIYYWFNILHEPLHYNIRILPPEIKKKVGEKLKGISELEPILNFMNDGYIPEHYKYFFANTRERDKIRNERYQLVFPEFYKIMKETPPEPKELFI